MAAEPEDFNPTQSNPLYQFRAPKRMPKNHAPFHGEHFITQKENVINDQGIRSIYPGYFRLRSSPHAELDFKLWEDVDDERGESMAHWYRMTQQMGFQEAQAKDFDINLRVRNVWKPDIGKRITLGGRSKSSTSPALVLMWRTGERAQQEENERNARSDDIQKSVEQKAAEAAGRATQGLGQGIEVTDVSIEEGEEIEVGLREEA